MAISLDPYTWLVNLLVRLDGPGAFRFVLQPLVAMLLGVRDGRRDAAVNRPHFLLCCIFVQERSQRWEIRQIAQAKILEEDRRGGEQPVVVEGDEPPLEQRANGAVAAGATNALDA